MAKTKRFRNPLKSTPQTQCATHPPTPNQAPADFSPQTHAPSYSSTHAPTYAPTRASNHSSLHTQSARHPPTQTHAPSYSPTQAPTHAPTHSPTQAPTHAPTEAANHSSLHTQSAGHPTEAPAQSSSSTPRIPQESQTSRPCIGRESTQYWTVESIDSEEVTKKIRLKVKQVEYLPRGERIIVHFDGQGAAYGEAQGLLAGYLGTLAIDCKLFPINFDRRDGLTGTPNDYFENCFKTIIMPRFCFETTEALDIANLALGRSGLQVCRNCGTSSMIKPKLEMKS